MTTAVFLRRVREDSGIFPSVERSNLVLEGSLRLTDSADQVEQVRYSSYGVPFGLPAGDVDSDGDVDSNDTAQIATWIDASAYDVRGDLDLDGDVDDTDKTTAINNSGTTLGWGVLSDVGNRRGYAGYELDDALAASYRLYHVRNRVLNADLGRWTRRDPLEYVDGGNLYQYVQTRGLKGTPAYMSPQQAAGERPTAESDVFSLGVILYEMLAGKEAFPGPSIPDMLDQIRAGDAGRLVDEIPEPLAGIVRRALARDARDRTITMKEIALGLRDVEQSDGRENESHR